MRRLAIRALVLLAALIATQPGHADSSAYVAGGIEVAAEAEDAVKAKDAAIAEAMLTAYRRVAARIAVGGRVPEISAGRAEGLASSFSIDREVIGANGYRATFTVSFSPEGMRRHLSASGVRVVDERAPPVLVVPVLVLGGEARLWEGARQFAAALEAQKGADGLAPVILPSSSRQDAELDRDYLLSLAPIEATKLRMRYDAHSVVLAIAEPRQGEVRLTLRGEDAAGPIDSANTVEGGLDAAAAAVVSALEERWKRVMSGIAVAQPKETGRELRGPITASSSRVAPLSPDPLWVRVLLRYGDDWRDIRRRIEISGGSDGIALDYLEPGLAEIRLWPRGDPMDLVRRLSQVGLDLFPAGGGWVLQSY
ncbi:DUF2066 domain-containing protein [Lutibaculum baratangense]|uniref:DUF2066 domain-containing protein n=1 Tax=Lutibaculum baratangense AMV1 TaxID=631454 RepID=V4RDR1_9HYPH|nr:DUF2066 domain-containing protein [Lutibaculum baratangense]ESR23509.1 hypothetical protein N177_3577 [Lutibaculum baratangense AMV1]